jgi:hypothetical protein
MSTPMTTPPPSAAFNPLQLLRDYHSSGKPIKYLEDEHLLVFNTIKVPVDAKTAWLKKVSDTQYTVGAIWFFLENKDIPIRDYMSLADQKSFEKVSLLDKNSLIGK